MWTALELAARYGLQVRSEGVDPVLSGSSGWLDLQAEPGFWQTIPVVKSLGRRGVRVTVGKPAVETMVLNGRARVYAEHIDDALETELRALKVRMKIVQAELAAE